eukprot:10756284-Alexandrium_andersonii.AAC.1
MVMVMVVMMVMVMVAMLSTPPAVAEAQSRRAGETRAGEDRAKAAYAKLCRHRPAAGPGRGRSSGAQRHPRHPPPCCLAARC